MKIQQKKINVFSGAAQPWIMDLFLIALEIGQLRMNVHC